MYLYGSFLSQSGDTVTVHIVTENNRTKQIEIGEDKSGVFFPENPVEITASVNDTFDHLLRSQASIRLLTRDFIKELFCTSCMDAVVNIYRNDKCIFAGFIEPQTYSQPYNEVYDELEISCIDALSALQYSKYRNVGGLGVLYDTVKADAGQKTFAEIINEIFGNVCKNIDIVGNTGAQLYFDGSKTITQKSDRYSIFSQLAISELLFLGDDEDGVWEQEKVLTAILKYLNLHITQDGLRFYIFSWESVKDGKPIVWHNLTDETTETTIKRIVAIDITNVASNDTTISIGEVYNQIRLTCKVESVESIIESPLDDDRLISPYSNKQKYLTEFSSDGMGDEAYNAFYAMTHNQNTDYSDGVITDWYIQVMNNPAWTFPEPDTGVNLIDRYCQNNADQQALPNSFATNPGAAIVSLGKAEFKTNKQDNSPIAKIDMTNYLVVSVNGNGDDGETTSYPTEESLKNNAPCAVYTGGTTGAVYSPSDYNATNYLVISGKILLNPIMKFSRAYPDLYSKIWEPVEGIFEDKGVWVRHQFVPSRNKGWRYYTQRYYKASTPFNYPSYDSDTARGLVPFTETGPQEYEFKYSAIGDGTDTISKIGVLACMLIIGDKCLVETGTDGRPSDFVWRKYKTREQCATDDEYYEQTFTIGFDPKIGDKLIGTEFSVQNNIDYTLGIDAEGIAIPIRKSDKLSGEVKFMILGPVNSLWDVITRRHRTWFRREKWNSTSIPLMAHVSSIFMKSFEIKIYSDNGLINNTDDNDIVYMSDTRETFVNPKDDIEFEISSALTLTECLQLGVNDAVKLSTPLNTVSGEGLLTIYDHSRLEQAKPEQLYVDSYYTEYHKPRIVMVQKINDCADVSLFNHYQHPAMPDKEFYVQSISRNLIEGYAELTLKEVWHD